MEIKIVLKDKTEYLLPDISYEKFFQYMFEFGSSDIAYQKYLNENEMIDIFDIDKDEFIDSEIHFIHSDKGKIVFKYLEN